MIEKINQLAELNSFLLTFFGVTIWGVLGLLYKFLKHRQDLKAIEKNETSESIDLLKAALLAILHNKIYTLCMSYIEAGEIAVDDLDDLNYLFKAYKSLGGNGTGETLYEEVIHLNKKKGK